MEELRYSQMSVSCSTYLHIFVTALLLLHVLLDKVLLGDDARAEVADPVHRNNSNVLNCTQ